MRVRVRVRARVRNRARGRVRGRGRGRVREVAQHHGVGALHADADVALVDLARQRGAHAAVDAQVAHELLQLVVQVLAQLGLGHPLLLKLTRALSGLLLLPRALGQVRLHRSSNSVSIAPQ